MLMDIDSSGNENSQIVILMTIPLLSVAFSVQHMRFCIFYILTILQPVSLSHLKFGMSTIIHTWVHMSCNYHTDC